MNDYEMMYIVHPDVDEDGLTAVNERVGKWITDQSGELVDTNVWGRRRLAYAIAKQTEGSYVVLNFRLGSAKLLELDRSLKLDEQILRHMILRTSD